MTKTEAEVLFNVVQRLKGEGNASSDVKAVLASKPFKLWLDTWVIAPLTYITPGDNRDPALALSLSR